MDRRIDGNVVCKRFLDWKSVLPIGRQRGDCFRQPRKSVFLSIGVSMCVDNTSLEKGLPSNIHR